MYDSTKTKYKRSASKYAGRKTGSKALVKAKTRPVEQYTKATPLMRKMVNEIIQRGEEKKIGQIVGNLNLGAYNTGNPYTSQNILPMTPYAVVGMTIAPGTNQNQRIGNRITVVSARLKGVMWPTPYGANNANPVPQNVRCWFFTPKVSNILPSSLPNFLQGSNGNSNSPQGVILDLVQHVNTDAYRYLAHYDFKVAPATYSATAGVSTQSWYYANNDYKWNCEFDIDMTKFFPKHIDFNDSDNTPYSKLVCCYWEAVDADGGVSTITDSTVQLYYNNYLKYTDA